MSEPEINELDAELDRVNKAPNAIVSVVGLLFLLGGIGNVLAEGINLVNGVAILWGGYVVQMASERQIPEIFERKASERKG